MAGDVNYDYIDFKMSDEEEIEEPAEPPVTDKPSDTPVTDKPADTPAVTAPDGEERPSVEKPSEEKTAETIQPETSQPVDNKQTEEKAAQAVAAQKKPTYESKLNNAQKKQIAGTVRGLLQTELNEEGQGVRVQLEKITKDISLDDLSVAMQSDKTVRTQMKKLEDTYVIENQITVTTEVSENLSALLGGKEPVVIGAGLNAEAGETVTLKISDASQNVEVNDLVYKNALPIDIKLTNEKEEVSQLKVPVTIQMPVPDGFDAGRLVVLHYNKDGKSFEVIKPVINADRTMTFTVTHFSTFVFAEGAASPKTSEHAMFALMGIMICLAGVGGALFSYRRFRKNL